MLALQFDDDKGTEARNSYGGQSSHILETRKSINGQIGTRTEGHVPMNILDSATNLIGEIFALLINERMSRAQQFAHVGIHKLCDDVDVVKSVIIIRLVDIDELQNVFMMHRAHEANFTNDALCVGQIIKHVGDLFHSDAFSGHGIVGRTNDAVSAQAQGLVKGVAGVDTERSAFDIEDGFDGSGGHRRVLRRGVRFHGV